MDEPTGVSTDSVAIVTCGSCGTQINVEGIDAFAEVECPTCNHIEVVPAKLGQFMLLDLMGEGGMGGVYRATDETLGRQVAIKVMLASLGDDPEFIASFRKEAQAIARLNHPHIAQIYSFGQEKGQPYIVMELVSGNRLDGLMEKTEQLDQGLILRTAIEVSMGLQAADEAGLVHGDIKPENILYDEKEQAKLVDFGLASAAHEKSQDQAIWGTPYYIPPEKIRRQKLDARADIYSLGGTLYHALTGKPPFDGETAIEVVKARLEAPPTPIAELRPDIDERLGSIVMRMLELDPARRYPTYGSLLSDLRKCAEESNIQMAPKSRKMGKKKVRIKKRGSGPSTAPAASASSGGAASGPDSRRLVIHKSTTGAVGTHVQPPAGPTLEELEAQKARKDANKRKATRITLTLLVLVAIAGAVTGIILQKNARKRAQQAHYTLSESQRRGAEASVQIHATIAQLQELSSTAANLRDQINDDAQRITGSIPDLPPLQLPEPPAPEVGTNATDTVTNETAEATNAVADVSASPDAPAVADGNGTNAGDVVAVEVPEEPVEVPEIHTLAIEVGIGHRNIALLARQASTQRELAEIASNKLMQAVSPEQAAPFETELAAIAEELTGQLDEAKRVHKDILTNAKTGNKLRQAFDKAEAERLQAEEEERKRIAAQEAADREQRERENRINMEKQQVDQARGAMIAAIQVHDYSTADSAIRTMTRTLKTPEGRAYLKVLTDRVDTLNGMKAILIERLTEEGFSYGYGKGSSARDILKADERGIYVRGAIAPVRWAELTAADTIQIVDYVLRSRTTRATQKMTIAAGAAIYCDAFGERGRTKGNAYADRAIALGMREEKLQALRPEGW